jgi:hypothetical protein
MAEMSDEIGIELFPVATFHKASVQFNRQGMPLVATEPGLDGFDHRTFNCAKCGESRTIEVAVDPMTSNSAGWLAGELKPPT